MDGPERGRNGAVCAECAHGQGRVVGEQLAGWRDKQGGLEYRARRLLVFVFLERREARVQKGGEASCEQQRGSRRVGHGGREAIRRQRVGRATADVRLDVRLCVVKCKAIREC